MPFRPDPAFQRQLADESDFREAAGEVAAAADKLARQAGAPWMPRRGHDLIEIDGHGPDIAVVNTDHGGHLQEWGSRNNPAHAPLRRAVRQAGLRLEET